MSELDDLIRGTRSSSAPTSSAPAESTGTQQSLDEIIQSQTSGVPSSSDTEIAPDANHNLVAVDVQRARERAYTNPWNKDLIQSDPQRLWNATRLVRRGETNSALQSIGRALATMGDWLNRGKEWLEANEFNASNMILNSGMQTPEMQAILAAKVISGESTISEAVRQGLRIDTGNWDIDDMLHNLQGLFKVDDPKTAKSVVVDGEEIPIPRASIHPSAGLMRYDITEEEWWRATLGDKLYNVLDSFAVNFSNMGTGIDNTYGAAIGAEAAGGSMDLSLADGLRLATFTFNDPLFLVPMDKAVDGARAVGILKTTPEMRALTGGRPLIISKSLLASADEIERYRAEMTAATDEFISLSPTASPEVIDQFKSSLPDFVAWRDARRRTRMRENFGILIPDTPEVSNRRAAYERAVYEKRSPREIQELQKAYFQACDDAAKVIASGSAAKPLTESIAIAVESLRSKTGNYLDIGTMVQDPKYADKINDILNSSLTPEQMLDELMKIADAPEKIEQTVAVIRNLENAGRQYNRVRSRMKALGMTNKQIEKRLDELMADAVVGLTYRQKYGMNKPGLTGAGSIDDWTNPLILSDEDLLHKNLLADSEVEQLVRLARSGEVPELSPIKLSAMSYLWGDPYFKTNFAPIAMKYREAQFAMATYLAEWEKKFSKILDRVGIRVRDRFVPNAERKQVRELYGRALSIERTLTPSERLKYYIVDGERITPEVIQRAKDARLGKINIRLRDSESLLIAIDQEIAQLQRRYDTYAREYERIRLQAEFEELRTGKPQPIGIDHPGASEEYRLLIRRIEERERLAQSVDRFRSEADAITDDVALGDILASSHTELDDKISAARDKISKLEFDRTRSVGGASNKKAEREFDAEIIAAKRELQNLEFERAKYPKHRKVELAYEEILTDKADEFAKLTTEDWNNIRELRTLIEQLYTDLLAHDPALAERLSGGDIANRDLASLVNLLVGQEGRDITSYNSRIAADNVYFLGNTERLPEGITPSWDVMPPLEYVINESNRRIHLRPVLEDMDLEIKTAYADGDPHRANYLKTIRDRITGKPTELDRAVDSAWYGIIDSLPMNKNEKLALLRSLKTPTVWATGLVHAMHRGLLAGSIGFMLKNLFGTMNTVGLAGRMPTLKGAWKYFFAPDGMAIAEHSHLTFEFENFMAMNSVRTRTGRAIDSATLATEQINRGIAFWVGVDEALQILVRQGQIGKPDIAEAIDKGFGRYVFRQGTDVAFQTQHIYGAFGAPKGNPNLDIWGSDITRGGQQFINYQFKQVDFGRRMLEDKDYAAFIRWLQTSGHVTRMLYNMGVDGAQFVGPYMGEPDLTGPAPSMIGEFLMMGDSMRKGDQEEVDRHWNNFKRLGITAAAGSAGIPYTPIRRTIDFARMAAASTDSIGFQVKGAKDSLNQELSGRDTFYRWLGLPSTTTAERIASTKLLRDIELKRLYRASQNANLVASIIQNSLEEERDLNDDERDLLNSLSEEMAADPISAASTEMIISARKRMGIPKGIRELLDMHNIKLLALSGRLDHIRKVLEVNEEWLAMLWGPDEYERVYKGLVGTEYEEATKDATTKILKKEQSNGPKQQP